MENRAEIGVIGRSGLYSLLKNPKQINKENRYGNPSPLAVGKLGSKKVAFITRHGASHTIPPHKVPFRANIEALASLGIKRLISTNAVGSLASEYAPGDFVFFDQFVNMTHGREDTFFDEDTVAHVSTAYPYCPELRALAIKTASAMGLKYHENGTVVVINGPRFSTKAESKFFAGQGFQLVNMTHYPEVALAREKELCFLGIGIVTDYDAGLDGMPGIKPVSDAEVVRVFGRSMETLKEMLSKLIPSIPQKRSCACGTALDGAIVSKR